MYGTVRTIYYLSLCVIVPNIQLEYTLPYLNIYDLFIFILYYFWKEPILVPGRSIIIRTGTEKTNF